MPGATGEKTELRRAWVDLGEPGNLVNARDRLLAWQDHGMGLLRTIMHREGLMTDMVSTRLCTSWDQLAPQLVGYDQIFMNVRSWTFPSAVRAARAFKEVNPQGTVIVGGMHATVALDEMLEIEEFDHICQGPGEGLICELATDPGRFDRLVPGVAARSMAEWPSIDRTLWPRPNIRMFNAWRHWPLERDPGAGWGKSPVASIITSRVCPWQCAFCNESSYIPATGRRTVDGVIEELNALDDAHGVRSVVIHDSMFFQNPHWLEEWLDKYPRLANQPWPYWAAARSDTVRRWPDLFEALVKETNWRTVSIGFESASERVLRLLNKECTAEDNLFTIELLNTIGDDMEAAGKVPPRFWSNIIWGTPGERPEDAIETMAMMRYIKRMSFAYSFYAPYPGTALGYQLMAEGKSLLTSENYTRVAGEEKVTGVDYGFYRDLLAGRYEKEVRARHAALVQERAGKKPEPRTSLGPKHFLYLFDMDSGAKKLAWGVNPQDALEVLAMRLDETEMAQIHSDSYETVNRRSLPQIASLLG